MDNENLTVLIQTLARRVLDDADWDYDKLDPRVRAILPGGGFSTLVALGNGRIRVQRVPR